MRIIVIVASALLIGLGAAHAKAPKMPEIFNGRWCGEDHDKKRCTKDENGILITAKGFSEEVGDFGCDLVSFSPQRPTRRDVEYRMTFLCGGEKPHRAYYRIGFISELRDEGLFIWETDASFNSMAGTKAK
jgi:hypothetical protein